MNNGTVSHLPAEIKMVFKAEGHCNFQKNVGNRPISGRFFVLDREGLGSSPKPPPVGRAVCPDTEPLSPLAGAAPCGRRVEGAKPALVASSVSLRLTALPSGGAKSIILIIKEPPLAQAKGGVGICCFSG